MTTKQWSNPYETLDHNNKWVKVQETCRNCHRPRGEHRAGDLLCPFRLLNGKIAANPWKYRRGFRTRYEKIERPVE